MQLSHDKLLLIILLLFTLNKGFSQHDTISSYVYDKATFYQHISETLSDSDSSVRDSGYYCYVRISLSKYPGRKVETEVIGVKGKFAEILQRAFSDKGILWNLFYLKKKTVIQPILAFYNTSRCPFVSGSTICNKEVLVSGRTIIATPLAFEFYGETIICTDFK